MVGGKVTASAVWVVPEPSPARDLVVTFKLSREQAEELRSALGDELYDLWRAGITEPIYNALDEALSP